MKDIQVLGFGDNVVDKYEHIQTMYPGGNCVNFSVYAKQYGVKKSAYMGFFGNDFAADHIIRTLNKRDIETIKCKRIEGVNGYACVTLVDGDRVFLGSNEGGIRGKTPYILDQFDLEYMSQFDLIHSGNYSFTESELPKIKRQGILTSFDFSDDSTEDYYKKISPYVNFAFCSFNGTEQDTKDHLKKIVSYGPSLAVASKGENGCMLYDGSNFYTQQAIPLDNIVDTMGAGDALLTSFLISYLRRKFSGESEYITIQTSLKDAANFAAKTCQKEGAFGDGLKY